MSWQMTLIAQTLRGSRSVGTDLSGATLRPTSQKIALDKSVKHTYAILMQAVTVSLSGPPRTMNFSVNVACMNMPTQPDYDDFALARPYIITVMKTNQSITMEIGRAHV